MLNTQPVQIETPYHHKTTTMKLEKELSLEIRYILIMLVYKLIYQDLANLQKNIREVRIF